MILKYIIFLFFPSVLKIKTFLTSKLVLILCSEGLPMLPIGVHICQVFSGSYLEYLRLAKKLILDLTLSPNQISCGQSICLQGKKLKT